MINCFPINLIQQKALRKIEYNHIGKYISLYYAKKVGFIFDASLEGIDKGITMLMNTLKARGVEYKGICIDFRKKAEGVTRPFLASTKVLNIFNGDVNWYGKPSDESITEFLSEDYDIIIDLTVGKRLFTVDYILKSSSCSLLVGVNNSKENLHDIIISHQQLPSETEITNEELGEMNINLVKNIINYLVNIR